MNKYLTERATLSVVCPVNNCGSSTLDEVYSRLRQTAENCECSYELIFVNDGSTDDTLAAIRQIAADDDSVRCVDLSRRFGIESAAAAGCAFSEGQAVAIVLPGEPADLAAKALDQWRQGAEIVQHGGSQEMPLLIDRRAMKAIRTAYGFVRLDSAAIGSAGFSRASVGFSRKIARRDRLPVGSAGGVLDFGWLPNWAMGLAGIILIAAWLAGPLIERFKELPSERLSLTLLMGGILFVCTAALRARLAGSLRNEPVYIVREIFGFPPDSQRGTGADGADGSARRFTVMT